MRVLIPLIVFFLLGLFVAALISPRRARRVELWADDKLETGEGHGRDKGGRLGDLTARTLRVLRRANNNASTAGRWVREKAAPGRDAG